MYGFIVRCVTLNVVKKNRFLYRRTFVRPGYLKKVQPEDKTNSGPRLKPRARKTKNKQNGHGTGC